MKGSLDIYKNNWKVLRGQSCQSGSLHSAALKRAPCLHVSWFLPIN